MEDNDNNKDNSDDKSISALGLDRDLGFSLGHKGYQGHQSHDGDGKEDDYDVEDNAKDSDNNKDDKISQNLNGYAEWVLAKIPGLYLIPELRYSCYRCCPCCCHRTYCCPPPRRHPP